MKPNIVPNREMLDFINTASKSIAGYASTAEKTKAMIERYTNTLTSALGPIATDPPMFCAVLWPGLLPRCVIRAARRGNKRALRKCREVMRGDYGPTAV